ncbi:MAG: protein kinase [Lentisphaeraceae bacterium]|nr:protein kinase [Lentisphaeraceae bacterium]
MPDDNETFFEGLNPLLKEIYEDASKPSSDQYLRFLNDTEGRYCEDSLCGEGGMKKVFAADDNFSGRRVAMGRLKDLKNSDSFLREVKLLARLEHPNIVPLYDVGMDEFGEPFLVMKLLGGCRLSDIFKKIVKGEQEENLSELLEIFLKVCDATAYAHSKGIVHADIKPENIQIDDYGSVLLCDWGLACDVNDEVVMKRRQSNGHAEGTPGSMAPEQLSDEFGPLSMKTDIYSLGCLLYSILSLKRPLADKTIEEVVELTMAGNIPKVDEVAVKPIPKAMVAVTSKAMSQKPEERYDSVESLTEEIRAYLSGFATEAEEASFFKQAFLFYMRNKLSCLILFASCVAIGIIVSVFMGEVESRQRATMKALKEVESQREKKAEASKIAIKRLADRADYLIKSLHLVEAERVAKQILKIYPKSETGHRFLGRIYFFQYRFKDAEEAYKNAGEKEPYFRRINLQMLNGEMTDTELIREMIKTYQETAVTYQLPIIYKKLTVEERYKLLFYLVPLYRTGGADVNAGNVIYDHRSKHLKIYAMRLRNISFISGLDLERLTMVDCLISGSNILSKLHFKTLNLENSSIRGVDDMRPKVSGYLNLSGTNLLDHRFLNHIDPTILDISNTEVVWLAKLGSTKNLRRLTLSNNQYHQKSAKELPARIKVERKPNKEK